MDLKMNIKQYNGKLISLIMKKNSNYCFFFLLISLKINAQIITTVAGNGAKDGFGHYIDGYSGDGGPATSAELNNALGVAVDASGNIYFDDDANVRIRKVDVSGNITTVAGNGTYGYNGDGIPATSASFRNPERIAIDGFGNLYIADVENYRIRKVDASTGIITTIAGNGSQGYSGDGGLATAAQINMYVAYTYWVGITVDATGNVYFTDCFNHRIRKINSSTGIITTVAGNGIAGYSGDGGLADTAQIESVSDVVVDGSGNLYIAQATYYGAVRKVDAVTGIITTIGGNGVYTGDDPRSGIPATSISLGYTLSSLAVDASNNVYTSEYYGTRIRKINTSTGIITTIAGDGSQGYSGNGGTATSAALMDAVGLAVDKYGSAYFGQSIYPSVVRKISHPTPLVLFTANNLTICAGNAVQFTDQSANNPTSWNWTFTGGYPGISGIQNPIVTYTLAGTYSAELVATNTFGSDTLIKTNYIAVNLIPTISVSSATTICAGNSTTISALLAGGGSTYTWSPATGLNQTNGQAVIASPTVTTSYSVTGTGISGCASTANVGVSVSVNPLPIISVNPSVASTCNGDSALLTAMGITTALPINYTWQPISGLISNTSPTVLAAPVANTTYTITGIDQNGCYNTATATVNSNSLSNITITPANVSICIGNTIPITASGGTTYSWYPATALNNNSGTPVIASPTADITYTVSITGINGCSGQATSNIIVYSLPIITASSNISLCSGNTAELTATGADTYSWNPTTNPSVGILVTASPNATTTYTVTGTDGNDCQNNTTILVSVAIPIQVTASPDITITAGSSTAISATQGGSTYQWTPTNSIDCNTCQNPTASPTLTVVYSITMTDVNGCSSSATVTIGVIIICDSLFIPDVFSPNADNINDLFHVYGSSCIDPNNYTFEIFDRWGHQVYSSYNPNDSWDGKYKGQELDAAVFVYSLKGGFINGTSISKKGNVSLIK